MEKIRIAIIDDETPARELIKHYLKEVESIEVVAECADGFSGLKSISAMKPDLVFLDIQMPRLTGIELVEVLTEKPEIIFTTAYDQFAIRAFELNAVDYLMKPFQKRRFLEAVKKAIDKKGLQVFTDPAELLALLLSYNWKNANLLLMTSGNFDGLNLKELAEKIIS